MIIGFSTGSLAKGDFKTALRMLDAYHNLDALEISALRERELPELVEALPTLDLKRYKYISIHAPSKLHLFSEKQIIELLLKITLPDIYVIVHPDIIVDFDRWLPLGKMLCIENMDKRKSVGRTESDLQQIFSRLPQATFCLDLAHAKQVDPSMVECAKMLRSFSNRLVQFHISDVTSNSNHVRINIEAILAYRKVEALFPKNIPFIIESPVDESSIKKELDYIHSISHTKHYKVSNPFPSVTSR
jgi:hypothetical protein